MAGRRKVLVSADLVEQMVQRGGLRPWRIAEEVPADLMLVGARVRDIPTRALELVFASTAWPHRPIAPLWNPTIQLAEQQEAEPLIKPVTH
jgi:hypothetical protein